MLWNSFKQMELLHKLVPILLQYATYMEKCAWDRRVHLQMPCVSIPSRMHSAISVHSYKLLHQICVIVAFLYYLHIPPPPDVSNFADFASFLWLSIVKVYAIDLHCRCNYRILVKKGPVSNIRPPPIIASISCKGLKFTQKSAHPIDFVRKVFKCNMMQG